MEIYCDVNLHQNYLLTKVLFIMTQFLKITLTILVSLLSTFALSGQIIIVDTGANPAGPEHGNCLIPQGTSAFIKKPDCTASSGNYLVTINIQSSCEHFNNDICNNIDIYYSCTTLEWYVLNLKSCFYGNPDGNSILYDPLGLSAIATPEGLTLNSISSPCSTIIYFYNKKEEERNCNEMYIPFNSRIQSHPNPTTGIVDVQFEGVKEGTANIQVYNNIGTLVQEIPSVSVYQGKNNTEMDLSNLPAGLYNIVIRQGETAATQRIQKL